MQVGIYIRDYMEDPTRPMYDQIEEAAEVCRVAGSFGFHAIYMPQHFIGYPTVWPQPMQILSRLAPEAKGLRLLTGIIMLPYHNPVDIAEQTVTMDQISNGRFTLGLGLGYREKELEAFGTNRRTGPAGSKNPLPSCAGCGLAKRLPSRANTGQCMRDGSRYCPSRSPILQYG